MNWIKVGTSLHTHPKVARMAVRLGVPKATVMGGLVLIWSIADTHTTDGRIGYNRTMLDAEIGIPGFSEAVLEVGWLVEEDGLLAVTDFETHNGQSAKHRFEEALRSQKRRNEEKEEAERSKSGRTTENSRSKSGLREEKRREEKSKDKTPHSPPEGGGVGVSQTAEFPAQETPQILETPAPARTDSRGQTENFRAFLAAYPEARRDYGAARFWLTHCERDGPAIIEGLKPWTECELWKTDPAKVPGMRVFLEREQWRSKPPPPAPGEKPKADPAARFTPEEEKRIWAEADKLEAVMQGRYRAKQ